MDGYILYRQYLDNICNMVTAYKIPRYKEKNILEVLSLSKKIEDLGYLDEIFLSAGESLSYLGNKDFMRQEVVVVSKMEKMIDLTLLDDSMQSYVTDLFRENIDEEEEAIKELHTFLDGLNSISDEELQSDKSLDGIVDVDLGSLLIKEKESIGQLFKTMSILSETVNEVKKEEEKKKEIESKPHKKEFIVGYKPNEEVDLFEDDFEDVEDLEEDLESSKLSNNEYSLEDDSDLDSDGFMDIKEDEDLGYKDSLESEEDSFEEKEVDSLIDEEPIFEDDFSKSEFEDNLEDDDKSVEDSIFEDDLIDSDLESKDFSKFIGSDFDEEDSSFLSKFERKEKENTNINSDLPQFNSEDFEDEEDMNQSLNAELGNFDVQDEDPFENSMLDNATDYFINKSLKAKQKASNIEELRNAYRSKERLKNSPDIESVDDNLAKMLLALGVAFMSLPSATSKIMEKLKGSSKKIKETMVVEDDEDE